ncbi:hypothetical protein OBV_11210 [Oscillibacter valericigenes Sjm18-20]|nr:hypothetical protein OBV_11210 [Oscillibacter valericigenes Sjm18-20]
MTHYGCLHCGPAHSTPDSLDAHGSLYFHFSGLKGFFIVGSYVTPIFLHCQEETSPNLYSYFSGGQRGIFFGPAEKSAD